MRRKERERDRTFALEVADTCQWAVLSMIDVQGGPYGVPVNLVRIGDTVYFHTALEGKKIDCLRHCPQVWISCVSYAHSVEGQFTMAYNAAMIGGTAQEVADPTEKTTVLRALCQRYSPAHMPAFDEEAGRSLARTGIWRISIDTITGKQKA